MTKPTQDELMRLWREGLPDQASLWDAGWAYQAGDYGKALETAQRALSLARAAGRPEVSELAQPLIDACRAKLSGLRPAGEVPDACAICGTKAEPPRILDGPFVYVCDTCLPRTRDRIESLRSVGGLQAARFAPQRPVAELCSWCGIGSRIFVALSVAGVGAMCYECLEDFTEAVDGE